MPRKSGMSYMMAFVQEYLDGELDRLDWDLDFNHYLIKHYPKMEREDSELADCFNYYLAEEGFDKAQGLPDAAHRKFIGKQFEEFKEAVRGGLF